MWPSDSDCTEHIRGITLYAVYKFMTYLLTYVHTTNEIPGL